jgi:hypothetical protein
VRIRNTLLWLLCGGILGLLLLREQERGTFAHWDGRQRNLMARHPWSGGAVAGGEAAVVLGRLDDRDREERVFEEWPLSQGDWQVLLQNLKDYRPRQTVVGSGVAGPGTAGLADAAREIPRLTVAAPVSAVAPAGVGELGSEWPVLACEGAVDAIPAIGRVLPLALPGAPGGGELDLGKKGDRVSVDGENCRVPLLMRVGERVVPAVVLRAVMEWLGISGGDVRVVSGVAVELGKGVRIPIDAAGGFTYHRPFAPEVPSFGADVFALPRDQVEAVVTPGERDLLGRLPESLLWLGEDDAVGRRLAMGNGERISPPVVMAQAVAVIQTGRFVKPAETRPQWMVAGMALLAGAWLIHWPRWLVLPGISAVAASLAAAGWHRFHVAGEWFPAVPAAGMLALAGLLAFLLPRAGRVMREVPVVAGPDAAGPDAAEGIEVVGGADFLEPEAGVPVLVSGAWSPEADPAVGPGEVPVEEIAAGTESGEETVEGLETPPESPGEVSVTGNQGDAEGGEVPAVARGSGVRSSGGRKKRKRR